MLCTLAAGQSGVASKLMCWQELSHLQAVGSTDGNVQEFTAAAKQRRVQRSRWLQSPAEGIHSCSRV